MSARPASPVLGGVIRPMTPLGIDTGGGRTIWAEGAVVVTPVQLKATVAWPVPAPEVAVTVAVPFELFGATNVAVA